MAKKVNVYTYYDSTNTVIGQIIPREDRTISKRTYNKLLNNRTIGGDAGIYTDAGYDIYVVDDNGREIAWLR